MAVNRSVPNPAAQYQHAIRDDRNLSSTDKLVAYSLAARYPDIHPSLATLAADAGMHKATVCRAVKRLEQLGWLKIARTDIGPQGDAENNQYELVVPVVVRAKWVVAQDDHRSRTGRLGVVAQGDSKSQGKTQGKSKEISTSLDKELQAQDALEIALAVHRDMSPDDVRAVVLKTNWSKIKNPAGYIRSAEFIRQMPRASTTAAIVRSTVDLSRLTDGLDLGTTTEEAQ